MFVTQKGKVDQPRECKQDEVQGQRMYAESEKKEVGCPQVREGGEGEDMSRRERELKAAHRTRH